MKSFTIALILIVAAGCTTTANKKPLASVGQKLARQGDEIMVCGQLYHTGAPVVLWTDPGGYDAYRTERRFISWDKASFEETAKEAAENKRLKREGTEVDTPNRYGIRFAPSATTMPASRPAGRASFRHQPPRPTEGGSKLTAEQFEKVRGGGWPLDLLQQKVDQFVYHYDVAASSRGCFRTLHDVRDLSVHFMLDVDGTIYQTLDLKERAWQASESNSRSIGIEICNMGAWPAERRAILDTYYRKDPGGKTRLVLPVWAKDSIRTPNFAGRPARDQIVVGNVQGNEYYMYDLTPQQYDSLIKLTAAVCTVFPRITPDYPRDEKGMLITRFLDDTAWENYHGLMGHYHVQENKQDPGPAFQWDKVINGARALMGKPALAPGDVINMPRQAVAKK